MTIYVSSVLWWLEKILQVSEQNGYILLHASLSNKHKINTAVVLDSLLLRNDPIIC